VRGSKSPLRLGLLFLAAFHPSLSKFNGIKAPLSMLQTIDSALRLIKTDPMTGQREKIAKIPTQNVHSSKTLAAEFSTECGILLH
jgi:hypothetical protein